MKRTLTLILSIILVVTALLLFTACNIIIGETGTTAPLSTTSGELSLDTISGEPSSGTISGEPSSGTISGEPSSGTISGEPSSGTISGEPSSDTTSGEPSSDTTSGEPSSDTTESQHTHEYTKSVVAPTCTEKGYTLHTCNCGDNYRDNEVPALGHTEVIDVARPATDNENGLTEGKHCSVCGEVTVAQMTIPTTGSLGLAYTVNPDGTSCTITGIGTCTDTEVVIGSTIDGYSVTAIRDNAFYKRTGLTSITIPDSVTTIGIATFKICSGLTSITIGSGVTSIGTDAFKGSGATTIVVSSENTIYHSSGNCLIETASKTLLFGCQTSVIPTDGSVTSIKKYAFSTCKGLTEITIPDSVTSIGDNAFSHCDGLESITIPDSVTSIGGSAFYGCDVLTSITFRGTKEQWNAMTKGSNWNFNSGIYTIHCTDGDLSK